MVGPGIAPRLSRACFLLGYLLLAGLLIWLAWFIAVKGEPGEATWESSQAKGEQP